jgi:serine/threonine protein kinase
LSSFDDETKADDDATIDSQKFTEPKSETDSGSRIGPYHLRQKIGEGGMGEVWLAEQSHPIKRKVALKIIKSGMDSKEVVSRFEAERQALALMDHPYVAKIYDAGTTPRGRPYFAMEYVQGTPITEHCDRHKLNVSERLELFRQVCEGVQHAHQKAIIHRDLKPGNVLVAEQDGKRAPSIIDFGVAKATAQKLTEQTMFTQLGALIGTPEYMSPEQAEMTGEDVDTRTDVYSLGVILYELLAGALPFDPTELREGGFEGIRLMIREKDPQLPSTRLSAIDEQSRVTAGSRRTDLPVLQRQLKGDLDWITMRALEKDRTRRYASPNEFAADVRRYLEHEPVLASPPSTTYRVKKFVRRNRGGVMAASLVLAALVLGMVGTTVGLIRATRAESHAQQEQVRAEEEAERANREAVAASTTARFLVGMFEAANPYYGISRGNEEELTAREVLDSSVERLDETLADQPETRAQLQVALGSVYVDLSLYDQAEPLLLDALEYYQAHPDDNRGELAHVQGALASLLNMVNRPEEAEPFARESVALYRKLGDDPESLAFSLMELAHPPFARGDYPEAEPLYREALTLRRGVLGSDHIETANTLMNFGYMLFLAGKVTDGVEAL